MSSSPKIVSSKSHRMKTVKKSAKKAKQISKEAGYQDSEDMDLSKPMFPLRHYLSDRSEFVDQLFQSLGKGNLLQSMLPDILKDIPQAELKKLCVQQLEVMSKKRVGRILDGNEMESSSETEDSDAENKTQEVKVKHEVKETQKQAADSTSCDLNEPTNQQSSKRRSVISNEKAEDDMLELHVDSADDVMLGIEQVECCTSKEAGKRLAQEEEDSSPPQLVVADEALPHLASTSITKTCMEIMELELRARAIKSLLKTQVNKDTP